MTEQAQIKVTLPNVWRPRHYQLASWNAWASGIKRLSLAWHRRAGKDDECLHLTACAAHQRIGMYWHMLPEYAQARKAIWDAVNPNTGMRRIDEAFPEILRESTRDKDMFIRFKNGSTWQVVGSDTFNSLVGTPPIGLVFSEYALANPQAWAMLRPILLENGGWAIFISTFRGRNHFFRQHEFAMKNPGRWYAETLTIKDTGAISVEAVEEERRELANERGVQEADAIIAQEYYCDPDAALPGAIYGALYRRAKDQGRVGNFPWNPRYPVTTFWDLGYSDSTAIWFVQQYGGKVYLIDYLEGHNQGLDWYAARLKDRMALRSMGGKGYVYEEHVGPHDANQHDLGTGKTRVETLAKLGIKMRVLPQAPLEDGIQAVRALFPRLHFNLDPVRCKVPGSRTEVEPQITASERQARGLDCIQQYHRAWNDKLKRFDDKPKHDWTSHGADALRYLGMGLFIKESKPVVEVADVAGAAPGAKVPKIETCPIYSKDEAPMKSYAVMSVWMQPDDRWGAVVCRVFRPDDDELRKNGLMKQRDSMLLMSSRSGHGPGDLMKALLDLREQHDVEHSWMPADPGYDALRRELWRNKVRSWKYKAPDPAAMIAIAREIVKDRIAWVPAKQWAQRVLDALERYPQHTEIERALAFACALTWLRHRNSLLAQDEDEPIVVRESRKGGKAAYA